MPKVFRSNFSRNVIILFSGLTIIFSLLIVVIPGIYRVSVEKQRLQEQKKTINTKVQSTYLPQAIYKAKYFDQVLNSREKDILIITDAAGQLLLNGKTNQAGETTDVQDEPFRSLTDGVDQLTTYAQTNNCSFYVNDLSLIDEAALERQTNLSSIIHTIQSVIGHDPIIQDVFVRTIDQTEWVCPKISDPSSHYMTYQYADQYYFPMTVAEWSIRWNTQFVNGIPVITVVAPIWAGGKFYGEAGISLQLSIVANQIPQYNLSDTSQLFILDQTGNVIAVPSWVSDSTLVPWLANDPAQYLNQPFTELMSAVLGRTLITSHLSEKIQATTPLIFPIDHLGERNYFALAPVGSKSIKVLVILPLEDVYTTLSFWGENFSTNMVPVLIELGLSILGISLILTAGAAISIRYFTGPIQEVSNTALHIAEGDLSKRVPEKWGGELLELARSFNIMANNVQKSEKELLTKKDELIEILELQKQEFEIIRQVVSLTNQVSKLSKKIHDVLEQLVPLAETSSLAVLLINKDKIYQSIFYADQQEAWGFTEDNLILIAQTEILGQPEQFLQVAEISPIQISDGPDSMIHGFAVPILERDQLIGLIFFCYPHPLRSSRVRRPFLTVLSNYIAVLIENADLQEKKRDLTITEERRHIANELHDAISQSLFSLSLAEESINHQLKVNGDIVPALNFLTDQTQHIQKEMRWLINELRPLALHRDNLENSLERQVNSMERLCPELHIEYSIAGDVMRIPIEMQNHLNRIVQEALSNIIRHANAKNVKINLVIKESFLELEISDDGIGFDLNQRIDGKSESYGIVSMYERSDQLKGAIDIQTTIGFGTKILVQTELSE